jgi:plasmid stabilization system protein ParE
MRVRLTKRAHGDIARIIIHIAKDSPENAWSFEARLYSRAESIGDAPYGYPERPSLGRGVRVCPFHAYNIYYRIDKRGVRIGRIRHSAQIGPLNS